MGSWERGTLWHCVSKCINKCPIQWKTVLFFLSGEEVFHLTKAFVCSLFSCPLMSFTSGTSRSTRSKPLKDTHHAIFIFVFLISSILDFKTYISQQGQEYNYILWLYKNFIHSRQRFSLYRNSRASQAFIDTWEI